MLNKTTPDEFCAWLWETISHNTKPFFNREETTFIKNKLDSVFIKVTKSEKEDYPTEDSFDTKAMRNLNKVTYY